MDPLNVFSDGTRAWFERTFAGPTPAQAMGWPVIATGAHTLIQAPARPWRRSSTRSTG